MPMIRSAQSSGSHSTWIHLPSITWVLAPQSSTCVAAARIVWSVFQPWIRELYTSASFAYTQFAYSLHCAAVQAAAGDPALLPSKMARRSKIAMCRYSHGRITQSELEVNMSPSNPPCRASLSLEHGADCIVCIAVVMEGLQDLSDVKQTPRCGRSSRFRQPVVYTCVSGSNIVSSPA